MARRKRAAVRSVDDVPEALAWRLGWLHRSLFPMDANDQRRPLFEALARYRTDLERRRVPLADRVDLVEEWLAERGRLDAAVGLVDSLERQRERW